MSTAKFDTLQNAAGSKSVPVATVVDGSAKAWVAFNGSGTVAIRAAFNCSSVSDNGVGDYTINFTNAFADAEYAVTGCARRITADNAASTIIAISGVTAPTTSALRVFVSTVNAAGWTALDSTYACVAIHD